METKTKTARFTKDEILSFSKYRRRRDLLAALLKDGRSYTREEVEAALNRFEGK